jgi:hypothetical protein
MTRTDASGTAPTSHAKPLVSTRLDRETSTRKAVRRHRRNFWLLIALAYPISIVIALLCVDRDYSHDGVLSGSFIVIHRGSCAVGHATGVSSLGWWDPITPFDRVEQAQLKLWSVGGAAIAGLVLTLTMGAILVSYGRLTIASMRLKKLLLRASIKPTTCDQCGYAREGLAEDSPCPECGKSPSEAVQ